MTLEEVHRAAGLTIHGWTYTKSGGWSKEGFTRKAVVTMHDKYGYLDKEVDGEHFPTTDDAYWAQQEREDGQ